MDRRYNNPDADTIQSDTVVAAPPTLLELIPENIPASLRRLDRWAPWVAVWKPQAKGGKGKYDKVPRHARHSMHNLSSKASWFSFTTAVEAWGHLSLAELGGVGFKLTGLRGAIFGDLDDCFDESGALKPWAAEIVQRANTYTERSPSGNGIRFVLRGQLAEDWTQVKPEKVAEGVTGIEMYGGNAPRFLTLTGQKVEVSADEVAEAPEGFLQWLEAEYRKVGGSAPEDRLPPPDMPDLLDEGDLPRLDELRLPQHTAAFLLEGKSGVDGSRTLAATAISLLEATATDDGSLQPEVVLSLMADNPYVAEIVERHRGDNQGKAVEYIWKHQVLKGLEKAKPVAADFDDISDEGGASTLGSRKLRRLQAVHISKLAAKPPEYLIKQVLPKAVVGVIFGVSTAGKSFVLLDMLFAIARGQDRWRGHRVKAGRVVYVAGEGQSGVWARSQAYARHHQVALDVHPFHVIGNAPRLLDENGQDVKLLAREIALCGGADVIALDTLAQCMAGGDENTSTDMGRAIASAQELHQLTGAMVLLVHHAGKDPTRGARGWSGLKGALDVELSVTGEDGAVRVLKVEKLKDGRSGAEYGFGLEELILGIDEDGDDYGSAVVVEAPVPTRGRVVEARRGAKVEGDFDTRLAEVQTAVAKGSWREAFKSDTWVGRPIAVALGLNYESDRAQLRTLVARWIASGHLRVEDGKDARREIRKFVRVGRPLELAGED